MAVQLVQEEEIPKANGITVPPENYPALYNWPTTNENGYSINEVPSGTARKLRIICAGAGASGINLAKFAQDRLQNVDLVIYEKNNDVAGTWWENKYPGCACDIPSVTYQFSWNPEVWSKYYAEASEIFAYFKGVVDKFDLWKYIKFSHEVQRADWDEETGLWNLKIRDLATGVEIDEQCDIFVNAMGFLNKWKWPDIQGLHSFKGILTHSAAWPDDLDLKGKRVAVVGNGSSGIQIVANIQKDVSKLYTWVRTPTWMTAGFAQKYAGENGTNFEYSEEQKKRFRNDPDYYLKYRKSVEVEMVRGFYVFHKNTPDSMAAMKFAHTEMTGRLKGHEKLAEALIPKTFPVGCKRPTPGNGYLEALIEENVQVYCQGGLSQITPKGFIDPDGVEQEVDVIICATGFDTSWVPRFPIVANGINLQDLYAKKPIGYLGVGAPSMPNYFTFYGPYGPLGQGSAMPMIELFASYIVQMVRKIQLEDIKSITPKTEMIDQYAEHADLFNKRTVYDAPCRSWFKGGTIDGRIMLHPGTRLQYMELLSSPRYEDYHIKYRHGNAWYWLGNGFSMRDLDGRDLTFYLGLVDGIDEQRDYDV
ncbi:hypothetical protein Z517_04147 [Fonsecaea pedrosoi CBS 271.37]|uniref:Unplaced genomic scaffold supercont1.3, whole genome shotgun sequence n=1 Tax=Fonsecaea pedrosoi CBS 271.37 TaxID=1442368 RepID=A0A0D2H977_9EURO|nr:uncharacterized protein Z517_04147 [Fonsecaea pedrosoi CBS 271.37]KIW81124.1 hypothetical protein Z517_04147 [Fonsecaea pedrosoi CBS 271.37]